MKEEIHKQLRFTIGEQYENYEFQLSSIGEYVEDGICFEEYLYTGESIQLFGISVQKVKLYFNGDILMKVLYVLDAESFKTINDLLNELINPSIICQYYLSWYYKDYKFSLKKKVVENSSEFLYQKI